MNCCLYIYIYTRLKLSFGPNIFVGATDVYKEPDLSKYAL